MSKTKIVEEFGMKYPIISAPMGPFYTIRLVIAVSEAGELGIISYATLMRKNSVLDFKEQIGTIIKHTDKIFGFYIRVARMQTDHKILLRKIGQWSNENPKIRESFLIFSSFIFKDIIPFQF